MREGVGIEVDGRRLVLRLTINAQVEVEELLGVPFAQVVTRVAQTGGVKDVRALVWAGLLHERPDLTLAQAGEVIEAIGLAAAAQAVGEAVVAAYPQAKGGEAAGPGEQKATARSTGRR